MLTNIALYKAKYGLYEKIPKLKSYSSSSTFDLFVINNHLIILLNLPTDLKTNDKPFLADKFDMCNSYIIYLITCHLSV